MHIRSATYHDAEKVLSWLNDKSLWAVDNPDPYQRLTLDVFAQRWHHMLDRHRVWMLEQSGNVIGQIGWVFNTQAMPELFITIADANKRGSGFGRVALQWLEQRARREGLAGLAAQVLGNNHVGLAFFDRMGYSPAGQVADRVLRDAKYYPLIRYEKVFLPLWQTA